MPVEAPVKKATDFTHLRSETVVGTLGTILKDYIPILAIVIGGIWYLSTEINQRPTKEEVGDIVQAKLDKFELTLIKGELSPIREDVIKIRSDIEHLIKGAQLGESKSEKEMTRK